MRKRNGYFLAAIAAVTLGFISLSPLAKADSTGVIIQAEIDEYLILQLETESGTIASPDNVDPMPGSPNANAILDFGLVDPFAINSGTLTSTNGAPIAGSLNRVLKVNTDLKSTHNNTAEVDGALYVVENGYQLRALRNSGGTSTDVDVMIQSGSDALPAVVDGASINTFTNGSTLNNQSLRPADGVDRELLQGLENDTPYPIDLGIFVPVGQSSGSTSTVITFTGT